MINTIVAIADIHFGCIDPETEFNILKEQFLDPIQNIHFDVLAINGDLFDRKFQVNSPAVMWAIKFVNLCVLLCKEKNATLIIIEGTASHDAGQLKPLFEDLKYTTYDKVYIVSDICYILTHGMKILCIPEKYGKGAAYYERFLNNTYSLCLMHGTIVGGVYGKNRENLNSNREPVFSIDSFSSCKGPILAGHVHEAMCLEDHMYYLSSPIRYKFGEENEKGYAIVLYNTDTYQYYYQFMPIQSFRYDTINIKDTNLNDPDEIIKYVQNLKANGIDNIRIDLDCLDDSIRKVVEETLSKISYVKIYNKQSYANNPIGQEDIFVINKDLEFLLDNNINPMDKLVRYINYCMKYNFIDIDRLKKILE